jgi:hypothetical protein
MLGSSLVVAQLVASQEGLSAMKLVIVLKKFVKFLSLWDHMMIACVIKYIQFCKLNLIMCIEM